LESYEGLCREIGQPPAVLGQAWLCHQPGVTAPVIGARTMGHLEAGIAAARLSLDDEVLKRLDDIFPGPGTAPEAYAW
jgi:NDP-hexose C3-ketoreductase / dTDP-4-oxo-2-deoxy-alpha-D-pentos-2-ene 2,3-reductase